jgi:hypothetical protein
MPRALTAAIALASLIAAPDALAEERTRWGAQALLGVPLNAPTPLTLRQAGQPDLHVDARWSSRPFDLPFYWAAGAFVRRARREGWAELIHHKLYLSNPPPEVQSFSVSHGFNLLLFGYGQEVTRGLWARAGAGAVIAHPEGTVRGQPSTEGGGLFQSGYRLAGPAASLGAQGRLPLTEWLRAVAGASAIAAFAVVPIGGGSARVLSLALHFTAGLDVEVIR